MSLRTTQLSVGELDRVTSRRNSSEQFDKTMSQMHNITLLSYLILNNAIGGTAGKFCIGLHSATNH